jgi:hypothetical protein
MHETRCIDCQNDFDQCHECAAFDKREEENKGCHFAEERGLYIKKSECGYRTIHIKQDACSKCGLIVNY